LITNIQKYNADRDLKLYTRWISDYKFLIPNNRDQLSNLEVKAKELKSSKSIFAKLYLYAPICGIQVQLHKQRAWVKLYTDLYPSWVEKREQAKEIIAQYEMENGSKWGQRT
jgi:hypothetical protein